MTTRRPAEVFPPGAILREELEERRWTQSDLAEILGRPARLVNELLSGRRAISPETALGLGEAFGTTADVWMNLEAAYQLSRASHNGGAVAKRAALFTKAPVKEMIRRGWIEASESADILEKQILSFFGIESLDQQPDLIQAHAARKSTSYEDVTPAQLAWLFRTRQLARSLHVPKFEKRMFASVIERLKECAEYVPEIRKVPRILSDHGIRFVVVEPLKGTKVDGATFWINKYSPVTALSLRYDRIDWFWHTLMHELEHVSNGDGRSGKDRIVLDTDLVGSGRTEDKPEAERIIDQKAAANLIDPSDLDDFILRVRPLYSTKRIQGFAKRIGVHPGIVVGQLQFRGEISYAHSRAMLVKVRGRVTESALTDGWGFMPPLDP